MKKFKSFMPISVFIVLLIVVSAFIAKHNTLSATKISVTSSNLGNRHVNGGGTTTESGKVSTFVFNAVELPDGTVNGHLNYMFRAGDLDIKMDIDCMSINTNRATLSGTITDVTGNTAGYPFVVVGAQASFTVQDNGNGNGGDLISDLIVGRTCAGGELVTYLPIKGNISIKQ
jgi:hypothetical protein